MKIERDSSHATPQSDAYKKDDMYEALRIIERLAKVISATPRATYKDWAIGSDAPYEMVRYAEAFLAEPRFVQSESAPTVAGDAFEEYDGWGEPARVLELLREIIQMTDSLGIKRKAGEAIAAITVYPGPGHKES